MANNTTFSLGDVVSIDGKGEAGGKVLDMRTRHDAIEYLIEHAQPSHSAGAPADHGEAEWIAADWLSLTESLRMP